MENRYLLCYSIKERRKKLMLKITHTNAETTKFIELDYPHNNSRIIFFFQLLLRQIEVERINYLMEVL